MSDNSPSKIGSTISDITGSVKEKVGHMLGSDEKVAEGTAQKIEANVEHDLAKAKECAESSAKKIESVAEDDLKKAKDYAEGAKENLSGSVKSKDDESTGDTKDQVKEKASQVTEDVKKTMKS